MRHRSCCFHVTRRDGGPSVGSCCPHDPRRDGGSPYGTAHADPMSLEGMGVPMWHRSWYPCDTKGNEGVPMWHHSHCPRVTRRDRGPYVAPLTLSP